MSRAWLVAFFALTSIADAAPPPHGATKIQIDYERAGWGRKEEHYTIEWKSGRYVTSSGAAIEAKLVDDLYASLTELRESRPLRCISHTDDYPKFKIVVDSATEPVVIEADSNCDSYRPWNIQRGGKQHVQFTGAVWRGVGGLLAALDKGWAARRSRTGLGGIEIVPMGSYPKDTGEPAACATSFAANAELKRMFGSPLKVDELDLSCDLGQSSDCAVANARAEFRWQGLRLDLSMPCSVGTISVPAAFAASQRKLATFAASKPVRALVKVSPSAPQLRNVNGWLATSVEPGLPTLSWTEGAATIDVRVIGKPDPAFWKELGIDAGKLPRRDGVTDVKLNLAGTRVQ